MVTCSFCMRSSRTSITTSVPNEIIESGIINDGLIEVDKIGEVEGTIEIDSSNDIILGENSKINGGEDGKILLTSGDDISIDGEIKVEGDDGLINLKLMEELERKCRK